jgi:hypothetical protein
MLMERLKSARALLYYCDKVLNMQGQINYAAIKKHPPTGECFNSIKKKLLVFKNNIFYISLLLIALADFCLFCKFHKSR